MVNIWKRGFFGGFGVRVWALNFGIADAAHVAFAEASADYFITCDDKLLKKISKFEGINMKAVNPVNFCVKENLR